MDKIEYREGSERERESEKEKCLKSLRILVIIEAHYCRASVCGVILTM